MSLSLYTGMVILHGSVFLSCLALLVELSELDAYLGVFCVMHVQGLHLCVQHTS